MSTPSTASVTDTPLAVQGAATETYDLLARAFEQTFHDTRGGVQITYITGEQVTRRLNEVLGPFGWNFTVVERQYDDDADEIWVHGRMGIRHPDSGEWIYRDQYGSQKVKRSAAMCGWVTRDGENAGVVCNDKTWDHEKRHKDHSFIASTERRQPLDLGFDHKGATTDALKKCASLFGVGLYLSEKEQVGDKVLPTVRAGRTNVVVQQPRQQPALPPRQQAQPVARVDQPKCEQCGTELQPQGFRDGTQWTVDDLAKFGIDRFKKVLCYPDFKRHAKPGEVAPAQQTA